MLPAAHRLGSGTTISETVRRGQRSASGALVLHFDTDRDSLCPPRAGLIVSRRVGPSVVRHRVQRRLRHLLRPRLADLPDGLRMVVRAQPAAATASSASLARDLDRALHRAGLS